MHVRERRITSLGELFRLIQEDRSVNDRSWFRPGCQAMAVYRFGVWRDGISWRPVRMPFSFLYKILSGFVRNFYGIELYSSARLGRRLRIAHQSSIVVHPQTVMGDDCLIRQGVSIGITRPSPSQDGVAVAPVLGDRVEVGAGAVIIGGITIGDDVLIGPNAVVMMDVPSGTIVTCPPPRIMPRPKTT